LVNPFDIGQYKGEKMPLINIATGTVAPSEALESLLNAKEQGKKAVGEFVQARPISDKENFWDPLKKINIKTFQSLNKPILPSMENQALKTINFDRQVYGRHLVVSKSRDIDLEEVQLYELASVPLALAIMDGSLRKSTKSTLLKELELDSLAKSTLPAYSLHQTAYIVDLLAEIQMLSKGKMKTFREPSDTIAGTTIAKFQFASQVHIVPDRYDVEDLIKLGERSRRSL